MAAEMVLQVFVSPLLGTVFNNLNTMIGSELNLLRGVKGEMKKLANTLSTIQNVLHDAEVKQITYKPIHNWLRKLKDVTYEAEDVLDECVAEGLTPGSEARRGTNIQVLRDSFPSCFNFKRLISRRRTIAKRIRTLREKFNEIADERLKYHLDDNVIGGDDNYSRQTSSFPIEPEVYGRDEDKEYIVNLLLNNIGVENDDHKGRDVSVCAILGMGGLGKTTLAQMVYNDERIAKHFEVKCWVYVSTNFELKLILKAVIESLGGNAHDLENLDPLQRQLQERLSGKKFLLVLDDVWNEDLAKWEKLKSSLRCGGKGSSIILTTRLGIVASITRTLPICCLEVLSDEDCWSLFKHRAFDMGKNENIHPNLIKIGKEIVRKCGGIPLAAKALGSLLRFKREESEWLFVKNSEIWDLPQDKEDAILPALRLSYNLLPSHLRRCFAYCSIFPKDYVMVREKLIDLWMANGFFQSKGESMELEDVGNGIFNELLWRSFFQYISKDEDDNIVNFKMHDLVHDLASSIMGDECSVVEVGRVDTVGTCTSTRHMSLVFGNSSSSSSTILESLPQNPPHIRTLLRLQRGSTLQAPHLQFSNLKFIRALDLSGSNIRTMPDSIDELKHLRYLNLSYSNITSLPNESFCSLNFFQTLRLHRCDLLQMLPNDMRKMTSLRHLDIRGCSRITRMPIRMGNLVSLRTLSTFIVGTSGCGIEELQGLNHLRGELEIKGMKNVKSSINAKLSNLMEKKNLRSLRILWSEDSWMQENNSISKEEEEVMEMVGEALQPHPNIKKLYIEGYGGAKLPSWMGLFTCLPNLIRISLMDCRRCEHLPSLGELPLLKFLRIRGMDLVKCIGTEFYKGDSHLQGSFPSLEELDIFRMPNLEEWSSPWLLSSSSSSSSSSSTEKKGRRDIQVQFPLLKSLIVESCPNLRRFPPLPSSLQHLRLRTSNKMTLIRSLESLPPCLSTLYISSFREVTSFSSEGMMMTKLKNLTSLKTLEISSCPKLKNLPKEFIENLTGLANLKFWQCDELVGLPKEMRNLTSLVSFNIALCHALISLPEMRTTTLVHLRIDHCYRLESLTKALRYLTTLETLYIDKCPELCFLPNDFQHLISLQYLSLRRLPKMTSLPVVGSQDSQHPTTTLESLKIISCPGMRTLPGWINNLISLQVLDISDCENLKLSPEELRRFSTLQTRELKRHYPEFVLL